MSQLDLQAGRWKTVAGGAASLAVVGGIMWGVFAMAQAAGGTVNFTPSVLPSYSVTDRGHEIRVTMRAVNTGTAAAGALCEVIAENAEGAVLGTAWPVIGEVVQPGRAVSERVLVWVSSADVGQFWSSCSSEDQWMYWSRG